MDPFALALDAIFNAPGSAPAWFTPAGQRVLASTVRVIRSRGTADMGFGDTTVPVGTNLVEIRRAEVAQPRDGDGLEIEGEHFTISGDPRSDLEAMTWSCDLIPA